ncbi:AMP-binding protein [Butyrivibrio sp. LC3010]|uniref:AMP-binding protein n=1 Tax=Butyrivibrio sp. LC3010 TaxID=1280680 RepID=UPI0004204FE0|nr:AMP-binding protein [Butyrivibrio sp. LC3010]
MKTILDTLQEYTAKAADKQILFDEVSVKGITYRQLNEMSGKIYAWLKSQGIGKEDFVLIRLPRGVKPVIAMIGIWKAGAAWALVEDTYAPERIEYIRNDCGCKNEISVANWEEIMRLEPLEGHEKTDEHDAAYAIYTSGTTGKPKGVLHEFGNLQRAIDSVSVDGRTPFNENDSLATLAPMNFVATVIVILCALNVFCGKNYIVSYETIKNPGALAMFFLKKRITITFLTPSYVRKIGKNTGPFLRMLFVGSEPANDIYLDNVDIINIYASSESGFAVGFFKIDKAYETCPIGWPQVDTKIYLKDENGTDVPQGEMGEICYENPYVRGYINLPEETKKHFKNGLYYSGDLARIDENRNLLILGRLGDMIKINGNRIEPAEIEAAIKEELGIDWCAVRGFDKDGKSFLCAYFTDDMEVDSAVVRKNLLKRLPYYMIPSYFMKIDKIPMKANGKFDRPGLPQPDISNFVSDYVAPSNDVEKTICEGMEKVLKLSKVGVNDDFYELGGDSLSSIELITVCQKSLKSLNAGIVFRGRTPKNIAQIYSESLAECDGDSDELNRMAMGCMHPLTAEQLYMIDYQLYTPNSTMYNLFSLMKLDKDVFTAEQLCEIMENAIKAHPALLTTLHFDSEGNLYQKYTPEIFQKIYPEKVSEFEFDYIRDTLVFPFKIVAGRMYRCRVFETEKALYVYFDVHHSLFDGTSLKVFLNGIKNVFMGMPVEPDYYYLFLKRREDVVHTDFYQECKKYFEDKYDHIEWVSYPKIDHESRENKMGELLVPLGLMEAEMNAMERTYKISRNEFFITVAMLSIAVYNRASDIKISWIYNGREDIQNMTTVGLLFRDLPVALRLKDDDSIRDIFTKVHQQVRDGIKYSCYPYVDINNRVADNEVAYLLYQQNIRDMGGSSDFDIETVDVRQNKAASQTILDMEILDGEEGLQLMIDYAASRYEAESIEKFKDIYVKMGQVLATHHSQADVTIGEIKKMLFDKKSFFEVIKFYIEESIKVSKGA